MNFKILVVKRKFLKKDLFKFDPTLFGSAQPFPSTNVIKEPANWEGVIKLRGQSFGHIWILSGIWGTVSYFMDMLLNTNMCFRTDFFICSAKIFNVWNSHTLDSWFSEWLPLLVLIDFILISLKLSFKIFSTVRNSIWAYWLSITVVAEWVHNLFVSSDNIHKSHKYFKNKNEILQVIDKIIAKPTLYLSQTKPTELLD